MTLRELLLQTKNRFRDAGIETPDLDARFLVQDLLNFDDVEMLAGEAQLLPEKIALIDAAAARRLNGEPVSRILGYREFWGRRFSLSPATLDPRPDTETLIEAVLGHEWTAPRILDLGTGSGCILLTLLHEIPGSTGVGIDLSSEACETAARNAQGLESRVRIRQGDWTESLDGEFDIIVSNPPYISSAEIRTLSPEVQNHDPILALDGGDDGLGPYKILLPGLKKFLKKDGLVFFEIGRGQLPDIAGLVDDSDATLSRVYDDLGGVPRVVEISYGDK